MQPPMIPQFTMGSERIDWSPMTNALAKMDESNRAKALLAEKQRQFDATNKLAQGRFGLEQNADARAAAMQPYQIQKIQATIEQAKRAGATEAQMQPLKMALLRAQEESTREHANLYRAQASAAGSKDAFMQMIAGQFGGGAQPGAAPTPTAPPAAGGMPPPGGPGGGGMGMGGGMGAPAPAPTQPAPQGMTPRPMSFGGEQQPDPMLIQTQAGGPAPGGPAPQPQGQPAQNMVTIPGFGTMPEDRARMLGMAAAASGKGELGKLIMESVDKSALGKEAKNANDKRELDSTEAMARLNTIAKTFDPKFLTLGEQLKQRGLSWRAWLTGQLPPEQAQSRAEFVRFQQNTLDNLNRHIQAITGAAMGVQEAQRIIASMPNMDQDPIQFQSALQNVHQQTALAIARYRFLRKHGFQGQPWAGGAEEAAKVLPLQRMGGMIEEYGNSVYKQMKAQNPKAPDSQIMGAVKAEVARRFEIDI